MGYSTASKAYRVYNSRTLKVEESIHVKFNDSKPDKELSKINELLIDLNIEDLHILSKEPNQSQVALLSELEPKNIKKALLDDGWIKAMKEELE
ncbi:hypothetical protein CR513_03958, partial [Mucuna pruriens]